MNYSAVSVSDLGSSLCYRARQPAIGSFVGSTYLERLSQPGVSVKSESQLDGYFVVPHLSCFNLSYSNSC